MSNRGETAQEQNPLASLSPREMEVFLHLVNGQRGQDIADVLEISIRTLDRDCASLMQKLGVQHVAELVRFAIDPDDDGLAEGPCVVAGGPRLPQRPPLAAAVELPRESTFCEAPRKMAAKR